MPTPRVVSSSDRIREIREERSRRRKIRAAVACVAILIILGSLVYISRARQLQIYSIVVRGNYIVASDDVVKTVQQTLAQKYLWLFPKTNVFLYPSGVLQAEIATQFPRFETITIHRENWNTLVVDVTERKSTYLWCDQTPAQASVKGTIAHCDYVDDHGYIFSPAPTFSGNVYFIFYGNYGWNDGDSPLGKHILDSDTFREIIVFKEGLEARMIMPYGFIFDTDGTYDFLLSPSLDDTKQKIVLSTTQDISDAYNNFVSALAAQELHDKLANDFANLLYIDLRFDSKVYYKWSDEK